MQTEAITSHDMHSIASESDSAVTLKRELDVGDLNLNGCDKCLIGAVSTSELVSKECLVHLCFSHAEAHRKDRFTAHHNLLSKDDPVIADLAAKISKRKQILLHAKTCADHSPEISDMICRQCEKFVCKTCFFAISHNGHEFNLVEEESVAMLSKIDSSVRDLLKLNRRGIVDRRLKLDMEKRNFAVYRTQHEKAFEAKYLSAKSELIKRLDSSAELFDKEAEILKSMECSSVQMRLLANHVENGENPFVLIEECLEIICSVKRVKAFLDKWCENPVAANDFGDRCKFKCDKCGHLVIYLFSL